MRDKAEVELAAMVDKTIHCLARIHPGFRYVRGEGPVVFCRDGTWQVFDTWPALTGYAKEAMRLAKVPAPRRRFILNNLAEAIILRAGPPIAVASRDDLPRNPFIGLRMKARRRRAEMRDDELRAAP